MDVAHKLQNFAPSDVALAAQNNQLQLVVS